MKSKRSLLALMAVAAIYANTSTANAKVIFEKTILAYNNPVEVKATCVKWASGNWPWPMKGGWKTCVGHKYETLRHDYVFVVDVQNPLPPEVEEVVRAAAAAAMPSANDEAVISAATAALYVALANNPLTNNLLGVSVRVEHRTRWS